MEGEIRENIGENIKYLLKEFNLPGVCRKFSSSTRAYGYEREY